HAIAMIVSLSGSLAAKGDGPMKELHDAYCEHGLDAKARSEMEAMKEVLEDALGRPLTATDEPLDMEAMLRAAFDEMQRQAQAQEDRRQARKDARQARKPKSARQQKVALESADARGALRALFRQLASALHPDRETDAQEQ